MPIHQFTLADLPATPWKNGGGSTTELWCEPAGAGLDDFAWRVSVATIASDGPFSEFHGVDRVIALLQGHGVQLNGPQGLPLVTLNKPMVPYAFAGETPVTAQRLGGDSLDFNVMTRRGKVVARLQVLRHDKAQPQSFRAAQGLILCGTLEPAGQTTEAAPCWQGRMRHGASTEPLYTLCAGQGLYWTDSGTQDLPEWTWQPMADPAGSAALLAVGFERLP